MLFADEAAKLGAHYLKALLFARLCWRHQSSGIVDEQVDAHPPVVILATDHRQIKHIDLPGLQNGGVCGSKHLYSQGMTGRLGQGFQPLI